MHCRGCRSCDDASGQFGPEGGVSMPRHWAPHAKPLLWFQLGLASRQLGLCCNSLVLASSQRVPHTKPTERPVPELWMRGRAIGVDIRLLRWLVVDVCRGLWPFRQGILVVSATVDFFFKSTYCQCSRRRGTTYPTAWRNELTLWTST